MSVIGKKIWTTGLTLAPLIAQVAIFPGQTRAAGAKEVEFTPAQLGSLNPVLSPANPITPGLNLTGTMKPTAGLGAGGSGLQLPASAVTGPAPAPSAVAQALGAQLQAVRAQPAEALARLKNSPAASDTALHQLLSHPWAISEQRESLIHLLGPEGFHALETTATSLNELAGRDSTVRSLLASGGDSTAAAQEFMKRFDGAASRSGALARTGVGAVDAVRAFDNSPARLSAALDIVKRSRELRSTGHEDLVEKALVYLQARLEKNPDRKLVLDHKLREAVAQTAKVVHEFEGQYVSSRFRSDGKPVLVTNQGATSHLWDLATGKKIVGDERLYAPPLGNVLYYVDVDSARIKTFAGYRIYAAKDNKRALISAGGSAHLVDTETGQEFASFKGIGRHLSADGTYALIEQESETYYVFSASQRISGPFPGMRGWLSPDGRFVLMVYSPTNSLAATLWDGKTTKRLRDLSNRIKWAAFSPDSRQMASLGEKGNVRLWDLETGQELGSFDVGSDAKIEFSPDGAHLLTSGPGAGDRKRVRMWTKPLPAALALARGLNAKVSDSAVADYHTISRRRLVIGGVSLPLGSAAALILHAAQMPNTVPATMLLAVVCIISIFFFLTVTVGRPLSNTKQELKRFLAQQPRRKESKKAVLAKYRRLMKSQEKAARLESAFLGQTRQWRITTMLARLDVSPRQRRLESGLARLLTHPKAGIRQEAVGVIEELLDYEALEALKKSQAGDDAGLATVARYALLLHEGSSDQSWEKIRENVVLHVESTLKRNELNDEEFLERLTAFLDSFHELAPLDGSESR